MKKIGIYFGSTAGVTTGIVDEVEFYLKKENYKVHDVAGGIDEIEDYDNLILITPTYGVGELEEHWKNVYDDFAKKDLKDKKVAIIGLGNQFAFGESFVGGMRKLYDAAIKDGAQIVGKTSIDGYTFEESDAVIDGKFVGLVIDETNQGDLTPDRIADWMEEIKTQFN